MTAALVMANLILVILAACGWFAFWAAQDQARGLLAERDDAEREAARLRGVVAGRGGLLPGELPIHDAVRLALVPEGGGESA